MESLYIYIARINIALIVFYLLYRLLFARDTFLEIRRLFLWSLLALAFTYPFITLTPRPAATQPALYTAIAGYAEVIHQAAATAAPPRTTAWSWQDLLLWIYASVSLFLLTRMLFQLLSICRMARQGRKIICQGQQVIGLSRKTPPFSFFNWIFLDPALYEEKELAEILAHEKAHASQYHSVDMIASELICILFWFNPVVWLLRKEIRHNLEFLADKKVMAAGYNRKNYQYHLLRLTYRSTAVKFVNNFNVSSLKKRIVMMNKKRTSRIGLIKYALLLPVTGLLILSANAGTVVKMAGETWQEINRVLPQQDEQNVTTISGTVTDEHGNPLPGATVIIKETSIGSVSDVNGQFKLSVSKPGVLAISYVGRKTVYRPFDLESQPFRIKMEKDVAQLDKVVVTGYSPSTNSEVEEAVFVVVEEMPVFPGGNVLKYIARQIKYPVIAQENGIQGTVFVSFVIDKNGAVTDAKVVKSVDASLDKEALRVINSLPKWQPGKQRGKAVDVQFVLPIEFILVTPQTAENVDSPENKLKMADSLLYIVDGAKVKHNELSQVDLNPENITSITVLKEKSSVALYGKEGEKGVVIITTKQDK